MGKILKAFLLGFLLIQTVLTTHIAFAQVPIPSEYVPSEVPFKTELEQPGIKTGGEKGAAAAVRIILNIIANGLIFIAAPIAILLIVHGGMSYTMAMGSQEKMDMAKKEITWAILGLVVIMLSFVIVRLIITTVILTEEAPTPSTTQTTPAQPLPTPSP